MNGDCILKRVERLEQENRRLRAWGAAAACLAAAALLAAAKPDPGLEAERFVLADSKGVERARLALDPGPVLAFFDEKGRRTLELRSDALGSSLDFYAGGGKSRLSLEALGAEAGLTLFDSQGRPRAALGALAPAAKARRLREGAGGVQTFAPGDLLEKGPSESPTLRLFNAEGAATWAAP